MDRRRPLGESMAGLLLALLCATATAATSSELVQEANQLSAKVAQLIEAGRAQDALAAAQRALEIREQELGPRHVDTATSVHQLARVHVETGAYGIAATLYERASLIRGEALGREHEDTVKSLNNLALMHERLGAYAKAERIYQQVVAIREKISGPDHPDTVRSMNGLALVYERQGEYAKAERVYQRAAANAERVLSRDHPGVAIPLCNLASAQVKRGAYATAESLLQRALRVVTASLGAEHPSSVSCRHILAALYIETGEYTKAEVLLQQSLTAQEKQLGVLHPELVPVLNSLAVVYRQTGAYTQAQRSYERALTIAEKMHGAEHPFVAVLLRNLASSLLDQRDFERALPLLQRALAIREKALGPNHPETASALHALALLYVQTGVLEQAKPLLERALAIQQAVFEADHPSIAMTLSSLASVHELLRDYAQAVTLNGRAIEIFETTSGPGHPSTAAALSHAAALQWALGDMHAAATLFARSQAIHIKLVDRFFLAASEARQRGFLQPFTESIARDVSFSLAAPASDAAVLGMNSVLQYKGRVLDAMSGSVARLRQSLKSEDGALLDELARVADRFSALTYQGRGALSADAYRRQLQQLTQQQEELQKKLASRSGTFRRATERVTPQTVQRYIPEDAVLLEWLRYQPFDPTQPEQALSRARPRYVVYVLKSTGAPVAIDVGDAQTIEAAAIDLRRALTDERWRDVRVPARALSRQLFEPLYPLVKGAKRLLVAFDGPLNLLPMAALVDEQGQYLLQSFDISYLTSGRDLIRLAAAPVSRRTPVLVADPAYGAFPDLTSNRAALPQDQLRSADMDGSGLGFAELRNTQLEAQALQRLLQLGDSAVLVGTNATEARFKKLQAPSILHVASHGFFLSDRELSAALAPRSNRLERSAVPSGENALLRSGLALAGANLRRSGKEDGILTALEIAQLNLQGTQLVVLSACDSGVGEVQNGEGVYGLRRALVLAGAQSQVTSLWKVADVAAKELMVAFYQHLLAGAGRSTALRRAQLSMLSRPGRSHPYYWAAFMPGGSWTPLTLPIRDRAVCTADC